MYMYALNVPVNCNVWEQIPIFFMFLYKSCTMYVQNTDMHAIKKHHKLNVKTLRHEIKYCSPLSAVVF